MMEKHKTIFLDRDGTINVDVEYVYRVEEFEFIPFTFKALKLLQGAGFELIIITNQSGIGRGYYTEEDFQNLTKYMFHEFEKQGIKIKDIYHCAEAPEANSRNRKPEPGLIELAVKEHNVDVSKSFIIGDKTSDIELGTRVKQLFGADGDIKTILVQTGKAGKDGRYPNAKPNFTAQNLLEAAKWILKNEPKD